MNAKVSSTSADGEHTNLSEWGDLQKIRAQEKVGYVNPGINDVAVEQDIVGIILQRMLGRIQEPTK